MLGRNGRRPQGGAKGAVALPSTQLKCVENRHIFAAPIFNVHLYNILNFGYNSKIQLKKSYEYCSIIFYNL